MRRSHSMWRVLGVTLALGITAACHDDADIAGPADGPPAPRATVAPADAEIDDSHGGLFLGPRYEGFVCSLDAGPIVIEGTVDLSQMKGTGHVFMIGLIDQVLWDDPDAFSSPFDTWGSGAYAYFEPRATTTRIGPTDGFNGGEIVQNFVLAPATSDDVYDFTLTVDAAGNVTVRYDGIDYTDTYGELEDYLPDFDLAGHDAYPHDEFEFGAIVGVDVLNNAPTVSYRLDLVSGCVPVDDEGPVTANVEATPNPAAVDAMVTLTADVDDQTTGGSEIASAEYTLDGGTTWTPMSAADGVFDEVTEAVTASFAAPTDAGLLEACVRGTDEPGNTGEQECTTVVAYDPAGGFVTGGGWIDSPDGAVAPVSSLVWDQGFEGDASGWLDANSGWSGLVTRVPSGTDGIASSSGSFHAVMEGDADTGPFSRFDAYRDTWSGSWTAEVDVYLDPSWPTGTGFDYTVAANGSDGAHQRDYIFHVGVHSDGRLLVNGSNNTDFEVNDFKLVNDGDGSPYEVVAAGWYTLQHVFRDQGGALAVDLNVLDSSGTTVFTTTRFNAADLIPAEVGGNRYAWFTFLDVPGGVAVDEHQLTFPVAVTGKGTFGFVAKYRKGAQTPDGNTEFQFKSADLNFHSTSYEWLVVNQGGENAQFKGEGTINGTGLYGFMLWAGDHDAGDTFRIRITDAMTDEVVYDNGMHQPIGGGNIIVHDGKGKGR